MSNQTPNTSILDETKVMFEDMFNKVYNQAIGHCLDIVDNEIHSDMEFPTQRSVLMTIYNKILKLKSTNNADNNG